MVPPCCCTLLAPVTRAGVGRPAGRHPRGPSTPGHARRPDVMCPSHAGACRVPASATSLFFQAGSGSGLGRTKRWLWRRSAAVVLRRVLWKVCEQRSTCFTCEPCTVRSVRLGAAGGSRSCVPLALWHCACSLPCCAMLRLGLLFFGVPFLGLPCHAHDSPTPFRRIVCIASPYSYPMPRWSVPL